MAQIDPVLVVQTAGGAKQLVRGVKKLSITWELGKPESMSYEVAGQNLAPLTPGVPPQGTRIIGFSLDGGVTIDARMLSGGTAVQVGNPPVVSEQGQSIAQALQTTRAGRKTAQQILLSDAFNGQRGLVGTTSGGMIAPGNYLPDFSGINSVPIGGTTATDALLHFAFVIDGAVATIPLDIDINRDTLDRICTAVTQRLGSYTDPQRSQWVADSGDFGVVGAGQTVTIGNVGTTPHLTFNEPLTGTETQPILEGSTVAPAALQMCRSVSIVGGDTHHGMPPSGRITDIVTINNTALDATGNFNSGMPCVAVYGDRNHGGVYYLPGDGALHPFSQAMGVVQLWYDPSTVDGQGNATTRHLYAATDAGVYASAADVTQKAPWIRLGTMALKVLKVVAIPDVYALVEAVNGGTRHVLKFDPGQTASTDVYRYDSWDPIYSDDGMFDFAVTTDASGTVALYALSTKAPGYLLRHVVAGAGFGTDAPPQISIPQVNGATPIGTGLDMQVAQTLTGSAPSYTTAVAVQGFYVRTDSGSQGLFYVSGTGTTFQPAGPILDAQGFPVMVNQVTAHAPGIIQWDTGTRTVSSLAATSAGVFVSASVGRGPWLPTSGQSNLGEIEVKRVASAPPRLWLSDQILTRVYGVADRSVYASENGTVNWIDLLNEPLDAGPAYFAAYAQANSGTYPNNVSTSILYTPPGGTNSYPVYRSLTDLGQFEYVMVNPTSQAPAGAHRDAEISQISAGALVPEVPLSQLLLDAMARFLAYTARPQVNYAINSRFTDTADPLRTFRPTHQAAVDGTWSEMLLGVQSTPVVYYQAQNVLVYCLSHTLTYDADTDSTAVTTSSKCGVLLLDDRSDPLKVGSDLWYMISRDQLYRSRRHN